MCASILALLLLGILLSILINCLYDSRAELQDTTHKVLQFSVMLFLFFIMPLSGIIYFSN